MTTKQVFALVALMGGCMDAAPGDEPVVDDGSARTIAASAATQGALGVERWRFAGGADGVVVQGLAGGEEVRRFWIGPGANADEQIAHAGTAAVTVAQAGAARGDAALRAAVLAFRGDAETAHKAGPERALTNVTFCEGNNATFGTAPFWLSTTVEIQNYSAQLAVFSFRSGLGYEEVYAYQTPRTTPPTLYNPTFVTRQWAAVPVTVSYINHAPTWEFPAACHTVYVY